MNAAGTERRSGSGQHGPARVHGHTQHERQDLRLDSTALPLGVPLGGRARGQRAGSLSRPRDRWAGWSRHTCHGRPCGSRRAGGGGGSLRGSSEWAGRGEAPCQGRAQRGARTPVSGHTASSWAGLARGLLRAGQLTGETPAPARPAWPTPGLSRTPGPSSSPGPWATCPWRAWAPSAALRGRPAGSGSHPHAPVYEAEGKCLISRLIAWVIGRRTQLSK